MKTLAIMAIPLTKGLFALVDGKNYQLLSKHKWFATKSGRTFYAQRAVRRNGKLYRILMHREILGLSYGDKKQTDHINHNGLDNRETNIRPCTKQQNHHNSQLQSNNTSGYKGVSWYKKGEKWGARIKYEMKIIYLGTFNNKRCSQGL